MASCLRASRWTDRDGALVRTGFCLGRKERDFARALTGRSGPKHLLPPPSGSHRVPWGSARGEPDLGWTGPTLRGTHLSAG